ncbi:transcriptional regulator with XRE-family HTH domain [Paenibacillus forsythiae]|uniref:Transcriptional regulator with XRE-family HTH domain n=1 Tax=Paenibacillus forsythiae TaxID=365616 RepID=A0ABU3H1E6_9BACL|nr:helix-turn-helix transcriptional regulator [Paenibacillus forsythiae]MDT3424633.1 transcriptional regulator with XRE-family HTH domain [Paenibacillus forsythiae]
MTQDKHQELGLFLRKKRASLTPEEVGLPSGNRRRVEGLRREEVAELAGVSSDWYVRLEQGRPVRPSAEVLLALSHALQLNRKEREYLYTLAAQRLPDETPGSFKISSGMQQFLDLQNPYPAYISDHEWNIIAWNRAALAVFGDYSAMTRLQRNSIWRSFMDPYMQQLLDNWEGHAKLRVSQLRLAHSQLPENPERTELIQELCRHSEQFADWWNEQTIAGTPEGKKLIHHPVAGDIRLSYLSFQAEELSNATITIHLASDTESKQRLERLLEHWTS